MFAQNIGHVFLPSDVMNVDNACCHCMLTNNNSSPEIQPNKGQNAVNNTLMKKLSHSDVSPKEQMLSHTNLKVVSMTLQQKQLHV